MDYRLAELADITRIVNFHKQEFSDYYLTQLGDSILTNYYTDFINSESNKCFLCVDKDNTILGLALFVVDFDSFISNFYKNNLSAIVNNILKGIFTFNTVILTGTLNRVKNALLKNKLDVVLPKLTLLSLAVSSSQRRKGIAGNLLSLGEKCYCVKEFKSYYLSVKCDNLDGIKFYKKYQFDEIAKDKDLIYMEKMICQD